MEFKLIAPQTNPFSPTSHHQAPSQQLQSDLINFYETPRVQANGMIQIDSTNPFASLLDSSSQGPQGKFCETVKEYWFSD